jgi:hypothetical protein
LIAAFMAGLALAAASSSLAAQPDTPAASPPGPPPRVLGPELWNGARIGMAQADIAKLFPSATIVSGEALFDGARSGLKLAAPFAGEKATAQFYFDATGGLETIIFDQPDVAVHQSQPNLARAHALAEQLSARYGKPADCAERARVASYGCTWNLGEAKAVLSYRDIGGATPSLTVSFRKRLDEPAWAPRPVRRLKSR